MADGHQFGAALGGAHAVFDAEAAHTDRNGHGLFDLVEPLGAIARGVGLALVGAVVQVDHVHAPGGALAAAGRLVLDADRVGHDPHAGLLRLGDGALHGFVGRAGADGYDVAALLVGALDVLPARVHGLVVGQHGVVGK